MEGEKSHSDDSSSPMETTPVQKMEIAQQQQGGESQDSPPVTQKFEGRQKVCSLCEVNKPINQFYSNIKSSDGVNDMCRKCQRKGQFSSAQLGIPMLKTKAESGKAKSESQLTEDEGANGQPLQVCATCGIQKSISKFYKMMVLNGGEEAVNNCRSCTKLEAKRRKLQSTSPNAFQQQQQQQQQQTPQQQQQKQQKQQKLFPLNTAPVKFCERCQVEKPAAKFYSQRKFEDGLSQFCRRCTKEIKKLSEAKKIVSSSSDVFLLPIQPEKNDVNSMQININQNDLNQLINNYKVQQEISDDIDWEVLHLEGCDSAITSSQQEVIDQCVENTTTDNDQHINIINQQNNDTCNNINNNVQINNSTSTTTTNTTNNNDNNQNSITVKRLSKGVSIQLSQEIGGLVDFNQGGNDGNLGGQPKFKRQNSAAQISV